MTCTHDNSTPGGVETDCVARVQRLWFFCHDCGKNFCGQALQMTRYQTDKFLEEWDNMASKMYLHMSKK